MDTAKALETTSMIIALWILAAIVAYKLSPIAKKSKLQILCPKHTATNLRVGQMALLDSTRCHVCIKEKRK